MNIRVAAAIVIVACAAGASFASGCSSEQPLVTCHDIPDGGCPAQGGAACQDPSCAAAYTCGVDGGWVFAYDCSGFDASMQDANIDAPAPSDAGVDIDAPPGSFGGPGCDSLEPPDCPLGLALVCPNGCCGCEDLFVCDDGGWDPWGACTDDAGITKL